MELAVPPFRPLSFRWALEPEHLEPELLVTRAVSLHKNWTTKKPPTFHDHIYFRTHMNPLSNMCLLPGGKLIVGIMVDPTDISARAQVAIFTVNPTKDQRHLIAQYVLPSPPFKFTAQWMEYKGEPGIVVSVLLRREKNGTFLGYVS
jgi:hypothetical protein